MAHEFDPEKIPVTSHGFFQSCIALIGASSLAEALGMSTATAYKQGEDPDLAAQPVRNRLDQLRAVFRRLENIGRADLAVSGIQFLADSIGMTVIPKSCPIPDKATLEEELLDDLPHVSAFHKAVLEKAPIEKIERLAAALKQEIDEDVEKAKEGLLNEKA